MLKLLLSMLQLGFTGSGAIGTSNVEDMVVFDSDCVDCGISQSTSLLANTGSKKSLCLKASVGEKEFESKSVKIGVDLHGSFPLSPILLMVSL